MTGVTPKLRDVSESLELHHGNGAARRHAAASVLSPERPRRLIADETFVRATAVLDFVLSSTATYLALQSVDVASLGPTSIAVIFLFPPLVGVLFWLKGLYRRRLRAVFTDEIARVAGSTAVAAMVVLGMLIVATDHPRPGVMAAAIWVTSLAFLLSGRALRSLLQCSYRLRHRSADPVLIVGVGGVADRVARRLEQRPEFGLRVAGFLDSAHSRENGPYQHGPVLGTPDDLARVAGETGARHVIVAFSSESDRQLLRVARLCREQGIQIWVVPRLFDATSERLQLEHLGGLPLFGLRELDTRGWEFAIKYGVDRVSAAVMVVCLAPLLLGLALAVQFTSPGPVFYRQRRVGRDGKPFDLLKFRSMTISHTKAEWAPTPGLAPGGVEGDADRRTPIGRWLRRSSLDELPQLFNVLRGEMSLIGPRPERPEYVSRFQLEVDRYGERHRVKSGITGWAQVQGLRGQTSIADRAEWDNFYIDNWSLRMDLQILALTVVAIFRASE